MGREILAVNRVLLLSLLAYALILSGLATLRGELLALALPLVFYLLLGLCGKVANIDRRLIDLERYLDTTVKDH